MKLMENALAALEVQEDSMEQWSMAMNPTERTIDNSIKEVLGFDVKVLTYSGEEKIIRFTELIDTGRLGASLSIDKSLDFDELARTGRGISKVTIELKVDCNGYSMEFIDCEDR